MTRTTAIFTLLVLAAPVIGAEPVSFKNDVMAVLSRAGCNSGPCHGNLNGKGGFKLSLRGDDPAADFAALSRDMLARRTDPLQPDTSLILQKAAGRVPHEGGVRFSVLSTEYSVLRGWIAAGCRADPDSTLRPVKLEVTPPSRILVAPADRLTLSVVVHFSDGTKRDVTSLAAFETSAVGIAQVKPSGQVVKEANGELVVLVRYGGLQVPVSLAFLPDRPVPDLSAVPTNNAIDRLLIEQWKQLRLKPSALTSDEVFVRRAYLDACGITPTADEVRRFLKDPSPDKRAKLIDDLLARPEFAGFWAQKWSDLLRNEEKSLDKKGVQVFYRWIKGWLDEDKPLTDFAREVLTGRGNTYAHPPANFYRAVRDPYQRAESVAQVFLGLRVGCAKCHNHPFDVWTQDDYHRFVALFARIDYRVLVNNRKDDLDKHEFVGDQVVLAKHDGELPHPRGGSASPKFLGKETATLSGDRLGALADWVAEPANPFFAKAQANRVWYHLFGRGLVDPNDDFRATNPAANPALLDHLATKFAEQGYRLKPLVRYVMLSRAYQLSASPNESNAADESHFSRAIIQPLEAEQLLDAVSKVVGKPVKFPGYPEGTRAGEVAAPPQTGGSRRGDAGMGMRFLKVFGKPDRLLTCECERTEDPGMLQAFQLITGELFHKLLRDPDNRLTSLLESTTDEVILDELYLTALARYPTAAEEEKLLSYVGRAKDRRAAWEDVAWGLVNAKEFLLRR